MSGVVVIKFGGGLITDKEQLCTVDEEVVSSLASMLTKVDKKLIVVHGAGSFGHLKSKKYRLSEGRVPGILQDPAIEEVRNDMMELNSYLMDAFSKNGIDAESFPPHKWASGLGIDFTGELPYSSGITVVFGDVVPDDSQEFGILSGDDLVVRYALETPEVEHLIFAVAGVDGLLKVPPHLAGPEDLFETWSSDIDFIGEHHDAIDVTGGIGLKAARGAIVAEKGIKVSIISGEHPERILAAIEGKSVIGTKIIPRKI